MNNNKQYSGGIPFTGFHDYVRVNHVKNRTVNNPVIITRNSSVDSNLMSLATKKLLEKYPEININIAPKMLVEKQSGLLRLISLGKAQFVEKIFLQMVKHGKNVKSEIRILLIPGNEEDFAIFIRNEKISNETFFEILDEFQYCYNLFLLGYDFEKLAIEPIGRRLYTPINSYRGDQFCFQLSILEKIKSMHGELIFDGLLPAFDMFCLPSYCIINGNVHVNSSNISYHPLSYNFEKLGIKKSTLYLKTEKEAIKYFKENAKDGNAIILTGVAHKLPFESFDPANQDQSIDRSNSMASKTFIIAGSFLGDLATYITTHRYFVRMKMETLLPFWSGAKETKIDKGIVFNNNTLDPSRPFTVLDIENYDTSMLSSLDALREAILVISQEYFKSEIIKKKHNGNDFIFYYGKKALDVYLGEIEKVFKNKKDSIAHVVIFDLTYRLKLSDLFLTDALLDLSREDETFKGDYELVREINLKWESYQKMLKYFVDNKKIKYKHNKGLLPKEELLLIKIFDQKTLQDSISIVSDIGDMRERLFSSLLQKLTIKYGEKK